jgi:hypothetical protein
MLMQTDAGSTNLQAPTIVGSQDVDLDVILVIDQTGGSGALADSRWTPIIKETTV